MGFRHADSSVRGSREVRGVNGVMRAEEQGRSQKEQRAGWLGEPHPTFCFFASGGAREKGSPILVCKCDLPESTEHRAGQARCPCLGPRHCRASVRSRLAPQHCFPLAVSCCKPQGQRPVQATLPSPQGMAHPSLGLRALLLSEAQPLLPTALEPLAGQTFPWLFRTFSVQLIMSPTPT